jgi:hypothetical protein
VGRGKQRVAISLRGRPPLSAATPGMTRIDVGCRPEGQAWRCHIRLTDEGGTGEHLVRVTRADLDRLAPGATDPEDLVRRSFEFLLEREPRTSILREFDLPVIARYFPEYEREIRGSPSR